MLTFLTDFLKSMLLPIGYPDSVSSDYFEYQVWDTLQGFLGDLKGIILTSSMLKGLGMGEADSSLDRAMRVWVIRDILVPCIHKKICR